MGWLTGSPAQAPLPMVYIFMDCVNSFSNLLHMDAFVGALMKKKGITQYRTTFTYIVRCNSVKLDVVEAHDQAEVIARQSLARRIILEESTSDAYASMILAHQVGMCQGQADEQSHIVLFTERNDVVRVINHGGQPVVPIDVYSAPEPSEDESASHGEPGSRGAVGDGIYTSPTRTPAQTPDAGDE